MFQIGDVVMVNDCDRPIRGRIVGWSFDEGNVWMVRTDGGNLFECMDSELSPCCGG